MLTQNCSAHSHPGLSFYWNLLEVYLKSHYFAIKFLQNDNVVCELSIGFIKSGWVKRIFTFDGKRSFYPINRLTLPNSYIVLESRMQRNFTFDLFLGIIFYSIELKYFVS